MIAFLLASRVPIDLLGTVHRLAWTGLLFLVAAALLSACDDAPVPTATAELTRAAIPLVTSTATPTPAADTIVVLAPFEYAKLNVSESDSRHYFLDLMSVLPNNCQKFDGIELERSGTEITVSITNRAPVGDPSDCVWVSRLVTHSVALGTDFTPGATYTVRVNGVFSPPILDAGPRESGGVTYEFGEDHVKLTFAGLRALAVVEQRTFDMVAVDAYTRYPVGLSVDASRPPERLPGNTVRCHWLRGV